MQNSILYWRKWQFYFFSISFLLFFLHFELIVMFWQKVIAFPLYLKRNIGNLLNWNFTILFFKLFLLKVFWYLYKFDLYRIERIPQYLLEKQFYFHRFLYFSWSLTRNFISISHVDRWDKRKEMWWEEKVFTVRILISIEMMMDSDERVRKKV